MTLVTFFPSVTCELFFRFIALSMTNNKWRNERKKANTQKKLFGLSVKGKGCPDASLKMPSQYYRKWAIENVNEHTQSKPNKKKQKNFNVSFVPDISKCFKRVEFVVTFVRLDYRYNNNKKIELNRNKTHTQKRAAIGFHEMV